MHIMNQTKKRLSIINLAISITDIETIQLQILKLRILHSDNKIQEIISTLQDENYAQAQSLITTYIDTPHNEILQRTFQQEKEKQEAKDQAIIKEFDLFTVETPEPIETHTMGLDDMMRIEEATKNVARKEYQENNFDSLLSIKTEDIMPDNIKIDISDPTKNDFWDTIDKEESIPDPIEKDTFFDNDESTIEKIDIDDFTQIVTEELKRDQTLEIEHFYEKEIVEENSIEDVESILDFPDTSEIEEIKQAVKIHTEETLDEEFCETIIVKEETFKEELDTHTEVVSENDTYKNIPYIDQKFKNMQVQYPALASLTKSFPSVDTWLLQIANEGYNEEGIETMIKKIEEIKVEHPSEAAQLLLITAATESKYAQFRLARALYAGDLIEKNLSEAFTIINRLAVNDDYPEAICDLAQFYEYGIGTDKDKKKAELLYGEAMDLGIQRAITHFERIKKENKSLFSFLRK